MIFEDFEEKDDLINEFINHKRPCSTAQTKLGLLIVIVTRRYSILLNKFIYNYVQDSNPTHPTFFLFVEALVERVKTIFVVFFSFFSLSSIIYFALFNADTAC